MVAWKAAVGVYTSAAQRSSLASLIPTLRRPSLAAVQAGRRGQAPHTGSEKWNFRTGRGVAETVCWTVTPAGDVRVFWARS